MSRRKGELSQAGIDRQFPNQVALPSRVTEGAVLTDVIDFGRNRSMAPLRPCFVRNSEYWTVWCFADRQDAEAFQQRFGGEFMAPADRPKWPG
jgi:hypothetical protein